jgi:hypothetical protein
VNHLHPLALLPFYGAALTLLAWWLLQRHGLFAHHRGGHTYAAIASGNGAARSRHAVTERLATAEDYRAAIGGLPYTVPGEKEITDMIRALGRADEHATGRRRAHAAAARFHAAIGQARERRPRLRRMARRLPLPVRRFWVRWYDRLLQPRGRRNAGRGAS